MDLHRGRIQAQGGNLEKSVAWSQASPPTMSEGLAMIEELISQLSPTEYQIRHKAFEQAKKFVIRTADNNGVPCLVKKSFRVKGTQDIRVDLKLLKVKLLLLTQLILYQIEDLINARQSFV